MAAGRYDGGMTRPETTGRHQFQLRSVLAAITWLALILAVCVQHQRTSTQQREAREHLMSVGFPPLGPAAVWPGKMLPKYVPPAMRQPASSPAELAPSPLDVELDFSPLPAS